MPSPAVRGKAGHGTPCPYGPHNVATSHTGNGNGRVRVRVQFQPCRILSILYILSIL